MSGELHSRLKPVRFRQQALFALHVAALGLLVGSCVAIGVAVARIFWLDLSPATALGASLAGVALGSLIGMAWQRSWQQAAHSIDDHYQLKDRTATALDFLTSPKAGHMHELQIADAVAHLDRVDPRAVAPWTMPRSLPYALLALGIAVALVLTPLGRDTAQASLTSPLPQVLHEAEVIELSVIPELEELAAREQDKRLEELAEELKELVEEMKEPGVDVREALATLSQMQAAMAAAQAEFNLEAVDASLKQLGEALASASAMKALSQALQEGKYEKAAEQLEELDPSKLTPKEAKTIGEQLKKLAKKMQDGNQGELSDATAELSEGIECENESQCKGGAKKLAGLCKSQGLRKCIGECLGCQMAALAECKGNCQGNKNGGQGVAKSDSPKQTWGLGASGQPFGDVATRIDATTNREDITGTQGDGPSEKEVSHSPEGREQARREYREKYEQYRRMTEAVLESEPLPLGHRQTIRKYFESIRPQNDPAESSVEKASESK